MKIAHERYSDFPSALGALANALRNTEFSTDEYNIVLTPDRYTLAAECALFKGAGSLNTEVLTLSRLCRRVIGAGKMLTREGGVMLTAKAIASVKDKLTYYPRAAGYTDFAREAYETLLQLESSCADANELTKASDAPSEKLCDLALIKAEYEKLKGDYGDSPDRLKDLIAAAKDSPLIRGSRFYAVGYKDATKLNRGVFDAIAAAAKSFTFFDADPPIARQSLPLYSAPDRISQYKRVAADILDYVRKGGRYGDVYIVCGGDGRSLARILGEYGIRYYSDRQAALFDTPPLAALYDLYRLKNGGDATLVSAFALNPFSGCEREDAERLVLELSARGSEYISSDYEPTDGGARRALKRVRDAVKLFRGEKTFSGAVTRVTEELGFGSRPQRLYDGVTDLTVSIGRLTEMLDRYGGESFDGDAAMFFSSARAVTVSSLPAYTDTVSVVGAGSLRLTKCKRLYVVDFNEGVLPQAVADSGLLSDAELTELGGVIEPTVREKNRRDREELLAVISNADEVLCSYVEGNGERESAFVYECADRIEKFGYAEENALFKLTDDARVIAKRACTVGAAREIAARNLNKHSASIAAAVGRGRIDPAFEPYVSLSRKSLSVSELKYYFDCPYKRFLAYSVGLKERRRGATAADFGTVMHEFMRRWAGSPGASADDVKKMIDSVLDDAGLFTGESGEADRRRIEADAVDFAELNKRVIEAGEYKPDLDRLETPFNGAITLGKNALPFTGVIDRIDGYDGDIRVIDYKTGSVEFKTGNSLSGEDLQLPLYVAALKAAGENVTGAFYVTLKPAYAAEKTCVSGFMLKDTAVALDYDRALSSGERSELFPLRLRVKDGEPTGFWGGGDRVMDESDFDDFVSDCVAVASLAADEICSGYVEKTPTHTACNRCAFGALCRGKKPRGKADEEE